MLTRILMDAVKTGRLIIIDGGICRFSINKHNDLTITDIVSIRKGAGTEMLNMLIEKQPRSILAKVPKGWPANDWYIKKGFGLSQQQEKLNIYVLELEESLF